MAGNRHEAFLEEENRVLEILTPKALRIFAATQFHVSLLRP